MTTKEDAIKTMEYLDRNFGDYKPNHDAINMAIDALKGSQWIPCSERLPEVDDSVLVTTEWNDISIAWRIGIDKWFIHEGNTNATTDDLIAWMPLPEPYKERRTDEQIRGFGLR